VGWLSGDKRRDRRGRKLPCDGSFICTPNPGFFGTDTFEYYFISTPGAATQGNYVDWATVTITVNGLDYFLPLIFR